MEIVGFIGLGAMGLPMAKNIIKKGFSLVIMPHRNMEPVNILKGLGAKVANTPKEVAQESEIVITMLPSSKEVEEVILGKEGVIEGIKSGSVVIDMGTSMPQSTLMIAEKLRERDVEMLDAPVSRGVKGAEEGNLCIMVGGKKEVLDRVRPVLEAMGKDIFYIGPNGQGHIVKLLGNLISISNMVIIAESFSLGTKLGVNPKVLYEVLINTAADSYILRTQIPGVLSRNFNPGFKTKLASKDINLALDLAKEAEVPIFMGAIASQIFTMAKDLGLGEENQSAVIKIWEKILGIEIKEK